MPGHDRDASDAAHDDLSRDSTGEVDPEGRPLEDPNAALAFSQPRNVSQARRRSSSSDLSFEHDDDTRDARDLELGSMTRKDQVEGGGEEDGEEGEGEKGNSSEHTLAPQESTESESMDAGLSELRKTRTEVHGKDREGRYIISWSGDLDPENP